MRIRRLAAVVAVMSSVSCGAAAADEELVVSAATSLSNAFRAMGTQFEAKNPGTKVLFSFGASDVVLQQIINGAPAGVFASADQQAMNKAVAAQAIQVSTRVDFARNEVVLIVPAHSQLAVRKLADLETEGVKRITFGNPSSVPVGRYTEAALKHAGAWEPVRAKSILAQNVRQALDYVARAEVDAGFVFATDAALMPDKVTVVLSLASPEPVLYPMALTQHAGSSAAAQAFVSFALSGDGQAILAKYGFKKP